MILLLSSISLTYLLVTLIAIYWVIISKKAIYPFLSISQNMLTFLSLSLCHNNNLESLLMKQVFQQDIYQPRWKKFWTEELLYKKRKYSMTKAIKESFFRAKYIPSVLLVLDLLLNYLIVTPLILINMVPLNTIKYSRYHNFFYF